jgi:hypothetical protein
MPWSNQRKCQKLQLGFALIRLLTDAEIVRDITVPMNYPHLRRRSAQDAQDNLSLIANPVILLYVVEPEFVGKFAKEVDVEFEDRPHFIVCHRQSRIYRCG